MEIDGKSGEITKTKTKKQNTTFIEKICDFLFLLTDILLLILEIFYYIWESMIKLIIPMEKQNVTGEIVLITGAGHGIGKELAIGYASLGATVVCWDINQETNKQTMNEIKQMGKDSVYAYQCDVSNKEEVFNVAEKVRTEVGNVTIFVNNAGIIFIKKLLDFSKDEIDRVIDINLKAHYWMLQAFLPSMIEKNHGHVVALSSLAALFTFKHGTVYCATKAAIAALMAAIEQELRLYSKGTSAIKFTTVYPTVVLTGILKKLKTRFNIKSGILSPKKAASLIIDAQRRNLRNEAIPSHWFVILNTVRFLPTKAVHSILDFMGINIEA